MEEKKDDFLQIEDIHSQLITLTNLDTQARVQYYEDKEERTQTIREDVSDEFLDDEPIYEDTVYKYKNKIVIITPLSGKYYNIPVIYKQKFKSYKRIFQNEEETLSSYNWNKNVNNLYFPADKDLFLEKCLKNCFEFGFGQNTINWNYNENVRFQSLAPQLTLPQISHNIVDNLILPFCYQSLKFKFIPDFQDNDSVDIMMPKNLYYSELCGYLAGFLMKKFNIQTLPSFQLYYSHNLLPVDMEKKVLDSEQFTYTVIFDQQEKQHLFCQKLGDNNMVLFKDLDYKTLTVKELEEKIHPLLNIQGKMTIVIAPTSKQIETKGLINYLSGERPNHNNHQKPETMFLPNNELEEQKNKTFQQLGFEQGSFIIRIFDITGPVINAMYCSMVGCRHFLEINVDWDSDTMLLYCRYGDPLHRHGNIFSKSPKSIENKKFCKDIYEEKDFYLRAFY